MAKVGAQRAAVLTGRSKSTIQRAMNSGKLSYEQDANGRRIIDVSELERVFGIKPQSKQAPAAASAEQVSASSPAEDVTSAVERERLSMMVKMLEQQLATASEHIEDLKLQRDKWERQAAQVVITSQYSQKQAEELRNQLRERDERAKIRRLQYEEKLAHFSDTPRERPLLRGRPEQRSIGSAQEPARGRNAEKLDEQMKKLKAENENAASSTGSVFRFWKRAKG